MKKWQKSDFIDGAIFREGDDFLEIYQVNSYSDIYIGYFIAHGLFRYDDIDLEKIMDVFQCESMDGLKKELGTDWKRDAVLAWFDMCCQNDTTAYRVCQEPFRDYDCAWDLMLQMSGYEGDKDELEISRILTISTAHISPSTANLMDNDAINAGFYSKGEYGYHILTAGWENYADTMPQDLKDCVKFAEQHDCDWLCLDGDANIVPGLTMYECAD